MKENKISLKGDNIHINMDNGSIVDITISITSKATIPYAIYIYELITGYVECRSIYDKPRIELHSRGVLSELEKHYPCVKRIDRRGMPNIQIYPKNVDVHYEEDKDAIIITVKYSDKYNPLDLLTSDRSVWSNRSKLCDLLQNLFHINSAHDNATDKELNNIKEIVMGNETLYIGDNIEISIKDKVINNIVAFIPSDLNIPHVFMIYKILTGTLPSEYAIADLYPYEILTKLEACYPCVEKIRRGDLYNPKICPSGIGVGCDKNDIKITVVYGEYDKRDRWQAMQAYSIGDKRIRDAVGKVYGYDWTKNLTKELRTIFTTKGDNNMKYPETAYISNDIEINIKKRVINNITVYIPLYIKAADAVEIYDAITGYGELRPYEMLDDLKELYSYIKNIDRGEIDNDYIFIEDIGVFYEDTHVRIVVEYNKYSKSAACHIADKRIDLIHIFSNISKGDNIAKDRFYSWHNINIHVRDGIIDYMKLYIPLVAHSGILSNAHALRIYDIMTGHTVFSQFIAEEKLIKIDEDKYIKKIQSYDLLDKLKKYYPCLEGIHRNKLYDEQLYPKSVNVCYVDNAVKITVKYGYYFDINSFSKHELYEIYEIYSSISSEYSKLLDHLCVLQCTPVAPIAKLKNDDKTIEELKKRINAIYGVPTFDAFDAITDELKDTYIKKNHDYGNSFDKSIDKFGLTAAVVRMNDKMERLNSLINKDAKVDESIRDTVMDLANYCIMTAMYLDNKEKK